MFAPAGLEGYYHELACRQDDRGRYQDGERLVVVAARYGVDITGPPVAVALSPNPIRARRPIKHPE